MKPTKVTTIDSKTWAEISNLHEIVWIDAMNYKHGRSKYDKIDCVNSIDRQVKALVEAQLEQLLIDARIAENRQWCCKHGASSCPRKDNRIKDLNNKAKGE